MMAHADVSPHKSVLWDEVMTWLAPQTGTYCDATVGFAGHATGILEATHPKGRLIGLDRDKEALAAAGDALRPYGERVTLVHAPFSRIRAVLESVNALPLDGCLVDLGVSSPQLDRAERGFSFLRSGPLDMRMDQSQGETVAQYLHRVEEPELIAVLRDFGEERYAGRIARNIIAARGQSDLETTGGLAALVARSVPRHEQHKNPATRTFQALRIAINGELKELDQFLTDVPGCLKPGGRLVVIAFHSLEDRMVKHRLRALDRHGAPGEPPPVPPVLRVLTRKGIAATEAEKVANPRARSAHLRAAERVI